MPVWDGFSEFLAELGRGIRQAIRHRADFSFALAICVLITAIVLAFKNTENALVLGLLAVIVLSGLAFLGLYYYDRRESVNRLRANTGESVNPHDVMELVGQMTPAVRRDVNLALQTAVTEVAESLDIDASNVRANVFGFVEDDMLGILPNMSYNMDHHQEFALRLARGEGSTGNAFTTRHPNIAILRSDWGKDALGDDRPSLVHPDLRWIISMPIIAGVEARTIAVLNIDGLRRAPTPDQLREVVPRLYYFAGVIASALEDTQRTRDERSS